MVPSRDGTFVADLHIHSPYAFACSKALTLENLAVWARRKGIDLLATGDFTHPQWFKSLRSQLVFDDDGFYRYGGVRFVPGTEVSCVYRQGGKGRRVHMLVLMPNLESASELTKRLANYGTLENDGRPTVKLSAKDLLALCLDVDPDSLAIPAHAWTPWYGIFGSRSGFDSLEECFDDLSPLITTVESGLSSDPSMNRAVPELTNRSIVSFSDAHSPARLGREATAFSGQISWGGLSNALQDGAVAYTVEFYPEEGKYHYSGHRKCGVSYSSLDLQREGTTCPSCGRPLTLGVVHRVEQLAGKPLDDDLAPGPDGFIGGYGASQPPFARLIPLQEVISTTLGMGSQTKTVLRKYTEITDRIGSELEALLWASFVDLREAAGEPVARAILAARKGDVLITPGFDGQYGSVSLIVDK